jgi:hypothetical protein
MKSTAIRNVARMSLFLIFALVSGHLIAASATRPEIPADVRTVLAENDMLLAFHKGDITGDRTKGLVVVVYHGPVVPESMSPHDPCDLVVYEEVEGRWRETARSNDAVDCTNNLLTDNPKEMNYGDCLEVRAGSITWVNENVRSHVTFDFSYDKAKRRWYVQAMSQGGRLPPRTPDGNNGFSHGKIVAPRDFPLTPMSKLDRDRLESVLIEHTKTEY